MKKKLLVLTAVSVLGLTLTSCNDVLNQVFNPPVEGDKQDGQKEDPIAGKLIVNIEKTGTEGLVDTYTITFTDGTTVSFTVTNGAAGAEGAAGQDGAAGKSAYELAVEKGYNGTEEEWLASLVGAAGAAGEDGDDGAAGKSAYEVACENGYKGTVTEWLQSLIGETGAKGEDGEDGAAGKSAYELYVASLENPEEALSLEEWLLSLVGKDGGKGDKGETAYSCTILPVVGGYVTVDLGSAVVGEEVTFEAHAENDEYLPYSITLNGVEHIFEENELENGVGTYKVAMVKNGFVVSAKFVKSVVETAVAISANVEDHKAPIFSNVQFTAEVTALEGTPTYTDVTWSIESGSDYATIDAATGLLVANAEGTVVVKAESRHHVVDTYELLITATHYSLVTDFDEQLTPGSKVVLYSTAGDCAVKDQVISNYYLAATNVAADNKKAEYLIKENLGATEWEVEVLDDGYAFKNADGKYLNAPISGTHYNMGIADAVSATSTFNFVANDDAGVYDIHAGVNYITYSLYNSTKEFKGANKVSANSKFKVYKLDGSGVDWIHANEINITAPEQYSLKNVGDSVQLEATILPVGSKEKKVNWSIEENDYLEIDETGKVTVKAATYEEGVEKVVTATIEGVNVVAHYNVALTNLQKVTEIDVTNPNTDFTLEEGATLQLNTTVSPDYADNKAVNYATSDEEVATVDETGLITAHKAGTCTITLTAADGQGGNLVIQLTVVEPAVPVVKHIVMTENKGGVTVEGPEDGEYAHGTELVFTLTANEHYHDPYLSVNGTLVNPQADGKYHVIVDDELEIAVGATEDEKVTVDVYGDEHITIEGAGAQMSVYVGSTINFTATASEGYEVDRVGVTVKGQETELAPKADGSYEFTVPEDYTYVYVYEKAAPAPTFVPTGDLIGGAHIKAGAATADDNGVVTEIDLDGSDASGNLAGEGVYFRIKNNTGVNTPLIVTLNSTNGVCIVPTAGVKQTYFDAQGNTVDGCEPRTDGPFMMVPANFDGFIYMNYTTQMTKSSGTGDFNPASIWRIYLQYSSQYDSYADFVIGDIFTEEVRSLDTSSLTAANFTSYFMNKGAGYGQTITQYEEEPETPVDPEPELTAKTSTLNFTAACGGAGTANDQAAWTVASDGEESNYDATKGIHYGTGKKAVGYIELTSTSFDAGKIDSIVVNASGASGVSATLSVTVGGGAYGTAQAITASAANYTFEGEVDAGEIVVRLAKPQSATGALYVKSIVVNYRS